MPDGRVVHGEYFTHLMYGSEGIVNFQFHQTTRDHVDLYVIPGGGAAEGRRRAIASAVEQVKALTPMPITVDVREVDAIPLSSAGKHRFTRSDVR
jgi:hypothetical protein